MSVSGYEISSFGDSSKNIPIATHTQSNNLTELSKKTGSGSRGLKNANSKLSGQSNIIKLKSDHNGKKAGLPNSLNSLNSLSCLNSMKGGLNSTEPLDMHKLKPKSLYESSSLKKPSSSSTSVSASASSNTRTSRPESAKRASSTSATHDNSDKMQIHYDHHHKPAGANSSSGANVRVPGNDKTPHTALDGFIQPHYNNYTSESATNNTQSKPFLFFLIVCVFLERQEKHEKFSRHERRDAQEMPERSESKISDSLNQMFNINSAITNFQISRNLNKSQVRELSCFNNDFA